MILATSYDETVYFRGYPFPHIGSIQEILHLPDGRKGSTAFSVSFKRHWQSAVICKLTGQVLNCLRWDSNLERSDFPIISFQLVATELPRLIYPDDVSWEWAETSQSFQKYDAK